MKSFAIAAPNYRLHRRRGAFGSIDVTLGFTYPVDRRRGEPGRYATSETETFREKMREVRAHRLSIYKEAPRLPGQTLNVESP